MVLDGFAITSYLLLAQIKCDLFARPLGKTNCLY